MISHDDVIKWKNILRYLTFVRGIHRWPVNTPHKGQWLGALMVSFICAWLNGSVNNREAGDLRRHRAHYDVTVMVCDKCGCIYIYVSIAMYFLVNALIPISIFILSFPTLSTPSNSIQAVHSYRPELFNHDDVIKWKHFSRYWPFVRGIRRPRWIPLTKASDAELWWFSLICAWITGWVNNSEVGDLRRHLAHYDVIVMSNLRCCLAAQTIVTVQLP